MLENTCNVRNNTAADGINFAKVELGSSSGVTVVQGPLKWLLSGILMMMAVVTAYAQTWPTKEIRIVVPYTAGGAADTFGRQFAQRLAVMWGQPVVIDNRPGSATIAGAENVARSRPDGYTMLLTAESTMSINPHLFAKLPYNAQKDFTPVSILASGQLVLVGPATLPANTLAEVIGLARAKPGSLNYGSLGVGHLSHLAMETLKSNTGTNMLHIPFKGGADAIVAVVAGQVQLVIASISTVKPYLKSGRLKAYAIGGTQRSEQLPDVPTFAELGYPDAGTPYWFGLFLPAGASAELVTRISRDTARVVVDPEFREKQIAIGFSSHSSTPEEFSLFLRKDSERAASAVKLTGAKAE
jgi:tripartite-type tricarboxylate transporter receptor subunit TctC